MGCQLRSALLRQEDAEKDESALHWHELLPLQNGFRSIVSFYSHFKPVMLGGQLLFS